MGSLASRAGDEPGTCSSDRHRQLSVGQPADGPPWVGVVPGMLAGLRHAAMGAVRGYSAWHAHSLMCPLPCPAPRQPCVERLMTLYVCTVNSLLQLTAETMRHKNKALQKPPVLRSVLINAIELKKLLTAARAIDDGPGPAPSGTATGTGSAVGEQHSKPRMMRSRVGHVAGCIHRLRKRRCNWPLASGCARRSRDTNVYSASSST